MKYFVVTLALLIFPGLAFSGNLAIVNAFYEADGQTTICEPSLSLCVGLTECSFIVDDGLCPEEASNFVNSIKNLIVTYSCGVPFSDKSIAAAEATRIELTCDE